MNYLGDLRKVIGVVSAMSGLRLDVGPLLLAWIPLLGGSVYLAYQAEQHGFSLEFALSCWVFYYVGISSILGTGIKRVMITVWTERTALQLYDLICGLMFFNIGLGISVAALHADGTFELPPVLKWGLVIVLSIVGFGTKFWATWIVGVNTYYFRDLFMERAHGEFQATGPYKWLSSPMYGVGNLHGYCPALLTGSFAGLGFALSCHLGIFAFYFLVEAPFIKRTYFTR